MFKAGRAALILMFIVLVGGMMLFAGEHPLRIVLFLGGMTLLMVRTNTIFDRGRIRRGKPLDFTTSFADIGALTKRDWLELAIVTVVGVALTITGLLAFGGA